MRAARETRGAEHCSAQEWEGLAWNVFSSLGQEGTSQYRRLQSSKEQSEIQKAPVRWHVCLSGMGAVVAPVSNRRMVQKNPTALPSATLDVIKPLV